MFSWVKEKNPPPPAGPGNPGIGVSANVAFANGERSWSEEVHVVRSLMQVLRELGHDARDRGDWIELGDELALRPQIVQVQPTDPNGVSSISTIQVSHSRLVPQGVFEYQHSTGDDTPDAFAKGFRSWAQVDLPVFLEMEAAKPTNTMLLDFKIGAAKVKLTCDRRVILGPPLHLAGSDVPPANRDEHPFCPCCLFTRSVDAFRELIATDSFYGIRLFAMRNADGTVEADCRVNGSDWPAGIEPLTRYAASWPDRGFEFRKQYVAIRSS